MYSQSAGEDVGCWADEVWHLFPSAPRWMAVLAGDKVADAGRVRQDLKGAAGTGRVIRIVDERAGFCTSREESAVSRRTIACRVQY